MYHLLSFLKTLSDIKGTFRGEGNVHCFKHPKGNEGTKKSKPPFFHKKLVVNRNCNTYPAAVFMVRPFC